MCLFVAHLNISSAMRRLPCTSNDFLTFENPVVLIRPDDQAARNAQALQHTPVFQSLIQRHTKIVLAYGQQNRRAEILRVTNRILLAPDRPLFPHRPAVIDFTRIDRVARTPLRLEIDQPRVTDQRLVTRCRCLQPVCEMAAITCAGRSLPRSVDK